MQRVTSGNYTTGERIWLWALAIVGVLGINGVFVWAMLTQPDAVREALANPLTLAFGAEAALLVVTLAWLFRKRRLTRLHWGWFVVLSLLGSLAFAVPVALLLPPRDRP